MKTSIEYINMTPAFSLKIEPPHNLDDYESSVCSEFTSTPSIPETLEIHTNTSESYIVAEETAHDVANTFLGSFPEYEIIQTQTLQEYNHEVRVHFLQLKQGEPEEGYSLDQRFV